MKLFFLIFTIISLQWLHGGDRVYSQLKLEKWEELDRPILDSCPTARRIYEYFDIKKDIGIKIFHDKNTNRSFVVFWPSDPKVTCHMNGDIIEAEKVFEVLSVKAHAVTNHYDINGKLTRAEDQAQIVSLDIGAWFKKPDDGLLKITVTRGNALLLINWSHTRVSGCN